MQRDKISRFWDKYIIKLMHYNVPEQYRRWYVKRVEAYIKAHPELPLKHHTEEILTKYLNDLGRNERFQVWQFKQSIEALRILFIDMIHTPWAEKFPWRDYVDAATELPITHATIARDDKPLIEEPIKRHQSTSAASTKTTLFDNVYQQYPNHIDNLIAQVRVRHYSIRTEQAYVGWLARFISFHSMRDPATLDSHAAAEFLQYLVVKRGVSGSAQDQALNAIVFFYKHVIEKPLGKISNITRSKKPKRLPVVLSREEVRLFFSAIDNITHRTMAELLYGCGLRLMECVRLRVFDLDFDYQNIMVRNAKGSKDRVVHLPKKLSAEIAIVSVI